MTSLAEQLKQLAAPQTSLLVHTKKRVSFLFDPNQAAEFSKDAIYEIGISGLNELKSINPIFGIFEASLFDEESKSFERAVETRQSNTKLDQQINKFLTLLSPYFLIKSSHKVLEWLIRRYHIHEYNIDAIMVLILPYHSTNLFARMVQILSLHNETNKWYWLKAIQKKAVPLSKSLLITRAASDNSFFKFVCDLPLQAIQVCGVKSDCLSTLFSFYCTTIIGVFEQIPRVSELQVSHLLPSVMAGISSPYIDFAAGVFMVLGYLCIKIRLTSRLLEELFYKIVKSNQPRLRTETCLLLVALCQSCDGKGIVTMQSLIQLSSYSWFIKTISHLAETDVVVYPLLSATISTSAKVLKNSVLSASVQKELIQIVKNILDNIKFDSVEAEKLFNLMVDDEILEGEGTLFWQKWHHNTLRDLEKKYPETFDKVVSSKPKLLNFIPNHTSRTELFEKLNHYNAEVRADTVKHILSNLDLLKEKWLAASVGDLLMDDSPKVLKEALNVPSSILSTLLPQEDLINQLMKILNKSWQFVEHFEIIVPLAFKQFCCLNPSQNLFLFVVFPYLLPESKVELNVTKVILGLSMINKINFLKKIKKDGNAIKKPEEFIKVVQQNLKNQTLPSSNELLTEFNKIKNPSSLHIFTAAVLASGSLSKNYSSTEVKLTMELLHQYTASPKLKYFKTEDEEISRDNMVMLMKYCRLDLLPLQGALCILTSIMAISKQFSSTNTFWEITDPNVDLHIDIFKIILLGTKSNKKKIKNAYKPCKCLFFENFFSNIESQAAFLSNVMLNSSKYTVDCINFLNDLIEQHSQEDVTWAVETTANNTLVPALLVALSSPEVESRSAALTLLSMLMKKLASPKNQAYLKLLQALLNIMEEIKIDNEQVSIQLYMLLSPDPAVKTLHNKSMQKYFSDARSQLLAIVVSPSTPIHVTASILKLLEQITSPEILEQLIPLGMHLISNSNKETKKNELNVLLCIIKHINNSTTQCFQDVGISIFWQFVKLCLHDQKTLIPVNFDKMECPAILFLNQISRDFFAQLNISAQEYLLNMIVGAIAETENGDVSSAAASFMKRIVLDAGIVSSLLIKMRDITFTPPTISTNKPKRALRARGPPPLNLLTTDAWKQGVCLLELIQNKKKLQNVQTLLPLLFSLLNKCLEFEEQAPVEYTKQLLLSSILHCCVKLSLDDSLKEVPENLIQVELIVQCIRASQNPQTHHHALLVLSQTASMIPEQVLHNIMAIFTFMGSSVLRQDDAYSYQIISKIVETIIPVLIQRVKDNEELTGAVAGVLRVFVDALLDIPDHRRQPLLIKLINTLAQGQFLWVFLCLVFESNVLHSTPIQNKVKEAGVLPQRLEIALQLCFQFSPLVLLTTCHQLIKYVSLLPSDQDDPKVKALKGTCLLTLFDIERNTYKQLRHYMYTLLTFMSSFLSSVPFVSKIASLNENEIGQLDEIFKTFVESILGYVLNVSKMAEKLTNLPSGKYWRVMLNLCFDVLDKTNALLPSDMFLSVIASLMHHQLPTLRRKALELLNWRLQQNRPLAADTLLTLLPHLHNIIKTVSITLGQDVQLTQQTALISIKLLARQLAGENPTAFKEVLFNVTEILTSGDTPELVLASVVLCLGELCCTMRAHSIPALPKFMKPLIKLLHKKELTDNNDIMLLSVVSAVHKIVESLSNFLSPYLDSLIQEVVVLSALCQKYLDSQKIQPIAQKLKLIQQKLSSEVPLRVLLPAVSKCYNKLINKAQYFAIPPLMTLLAERFTSGNDLTTELSTFLLAALDFRNEVNMMKYIEAVEPSVISTTIALILKLSESSFKPFYYKIYEWAFRSEANKERAITFYKLTANIAECLKGLFVLFVNYFILNAATLLDENNLCKKNETSFGRNENAEVKACELVEAILKTLHSVFLYDANHYINKERFDAIMQPVVDQLENCLGGDEALKSRCEKLITPCLSQMAVSSGDDTLWKQLNYQILLKTRHSLPQVRLAGLLSACEVAKKLGEEFLPLLPETVPFLAELLEDENEEVEKTCHHVVQDLEAVLGEPIHKYF